MALAQKEQNKCDSKAEKINEWLISKKTADANQFAHLHNYDNVEKSEKKLRDQANSKTFKEFIKKS